MFVAVRATDIIPTETNPCIDHSAVSSSILNPAESAAVPWRLRQVSGLGVVGKWSAPIEDTFVLLAGGPSYCQETCVLEMCWRLISEQSAYCTHGHD